MGVLGGQGLGSSAAPPGLGGMATPNGGYAGSPGQGLGAGVGVGRSTGQLLQDLWSQQQLGSQQKQLQVLSWLLLASECWPILLLKGDACA